VAGCIAADAEACELLAASVDADDLEARLVRREAGEPLAWITGTTVFGGRRLFVDEGVYVPRWQTEELARRAADLLPAGGRALDLCTGAGAVAAHLRAEVPTASVVGVDVDPRAVACARRNGVPCLRGDLAEAISGPCRLDLVTAVAPYVPTEAIPLLPRDVRRHEPRTALDGGADGLRIVRRVVAAAGERLRPGGWLLVEVGSDQDRALEEEWDGAGFARVEPWWDEDGDLRGIAAQR
jgi:release factor glutamine methyltransferase